MKGIPKGQSPEYDRRFASEGVPYERHEKRRNKNVSKNLYRRSGRNDRS